MMQLFKVSFPLKAVPVIIDVKESIHYLPMLHLPNVTTDGHYFDYNLNFNFH